MNLTLNPHPVHPPLTSPAQHLLAHKNIKINDTVRRRVTAHLYSINRVYRRAKSHFDYMNRVSSGVTFHLLLFTVRRRVTVHLYSINRVYSRAKSHFEYMNRVNSGV